MSTSQKHILIIGAGVLGLTSALRLQKAGFHLTIIARDLPGDLAIDYASPWAGAHFRPVPVTNAAEALERELSKETYDFFKQVAREHPESGIAFVDGLEYFDRPSKVYTDLKDENAYASWDGFQVLPKHELPDGAQWGVKYDAWVLNSPVYLKWLLDQLHGVRVVKKAVGSIEEALEVVQQEQGEKEKIFAVINATGIGLDDPKSYISRGQFVHVSNEYGRTISHHHVDGPATVVVPRPCGGGTLLGGSKERRDYNANEDEDMTKWILDQVEHLCPDMLTVKDGEAGGKPALHVTRVNIGRRPMREGWMRIEREDGLLKGPEAPFVVHCYGAGGSGFKVSWAAARKVAELVLGNKAKE